MYLKCENCEKELNIPDSKLPRGKAFSIKCPGCGQKITHKPERETPAQEEKGVGETHKPEIILDGIRDHKPMESYLEEYSGDAKRALVCDKGNISPIKKALEEMGFIVSGAQDSVVAINKMKFNRYSMIFLNENFDGSNLKENPVLLHIQPMNMSERRDIFVVLTGGNFKTMDPMTSFALSVNTVINSKDINKLPDILKQTTEENERFYKIYREALVAGGRA